LIERHTHRYFEVGQILLKIKGLAYDHLAGLNPIGAGAP
jgi:hypothetical protein